MMTALCGPSKAVDLRVQGSMSGTGGRVDLKRLY